MPVHAQVNAEQVLNIGRNVLSMEDYLLAIQYFNLAIKAKPYLAEAYYLRGLAKLQLEDYEGAVDDCTLAINRNKFKTEAYKVRGFALQHVGRDSLAIADYDYGLSYNPQDKYFQFYKGVAHSQLKQYDKADSTLSHLIKQYPDFDDAIVERGRLNLLRGDTVASLADLNKAISLSHTSLNVYLMKANILANQRNWEEAAKCMDEVIKQQPDEVDFYINRAYLRYNKNDFFGAMADYDYAISLDENNEAAVFNRALLRTEVKALQLAAEDFSRVLKLDPTNFYALYNRALIYLETKNYKKALSDFRAIAKKYPRFHPAYYAIAECQRNLGNLQDMFDNIKKADNLIANYVANPKRNPLDRPTIAPGKSNSKGGPSEEESPEEFMEKFNRLMTSEPTDGPQMAFNDRIKGRVQDRNINISPEEEYALSFFAPSVGLSNRSDNFRNLESLNRRQYITRKIYVTGESPTPSDNGMLQRTFGIEEEFSAAIATSDTPRPIDLLARGIARIMLKNYDGAIADLTQAVNGSDDFTAALFARAYAFSHRAATDDKGLKRNNDLMLAMKDLDALLAIDPTMTYGWFNKGVIYYNTGDYTSAIDAFSRAAEIDPSFGSAIFNRGLAYIRQGNKQKAFTDLSKAGELGIMQSYNLLKRLK